MALWTCEFVLYWAVPGLSGPEDSVRERDEHAGKARVIPSSLPQRAACGNTGGKARASTRVLVARRDALDPDGAVIDGGGRATLSP